MSGFNQGVAVGSSFAFIVGVGLTIACAIVGALKGNIKDGFVGALVTFLASIFGAFAIGGLLLILPVGIYFTHRASKSPETGRAERPSS